MVDVEIDHAEFYDGGGGLMAVIEVLVHLAVKDTVEDLGFGLEGGLFGEALLDCVEGDGEVFIKVVFVAQLDFVGIRSVQSQKCLTRIAIGELAEEHLSEEIL